jgi:hypothetical protein
MFMSWMRKAWRLMENECAEANVLEDIDSRLGFALRARRLWDNAVVMRRIPHVPSLRVLKEGSYEGVTGIYEYGHRAALHRDRRRTNHEEWLNS